MQLIVLFLLIIIIILLIIIVDLLPIIRNWILRIKIGRYENSLQWNKDITYIGAKWLNKTPNIKITDNKRLIVLDILKGNYSNDSLQSWQEASLILGIIGYLKHNKDIVVINNIKQFLDSKFDENGQWKVKPKHVDSVILAYAIQNLDFINHDKYKLAMDYTWELIRNHIGEDGTVMYRKSMPNYRYVDTIGFICPFLVSYGINNKKEECIELAINQIEKYVEYGMLDQSFLPSHAYDCITKLPLGLYGWGRGLGWFAIGLIDSWNELVETHEYKYKLEKIIKRFAVDTIQFQQKEGNWNWTVTRNESRADSSATATLGWFYLNAAKIDDISDICIEKAVSAMKYLQKVTRRNGEVDFSQGDTKDIGVYSNSFDIFPFTQGFCIRSSNLYLDIINRNNQFERLGENEEEETLNENNCIHPNV